MLSLSYFAGRFLENRLPAGVCNIFIWVGAYWLGLMIYLLLGVLLTDILRLFNYIIGFFPSFITRNYVRTKEITAIIILLVSIILVIAGRINALNPRIKTLTLKIPKKIENQKHLNVVMASDIHLGTLIGNGRLSYLVNKINSFNPDLVLLAGDIVDEDIGQVIKLNLGETLKMIKSKWGVYGITGNHEYIGGVEPAVNYLEKHGVIMLRDTAVKLNDSFFIVGREDRSINQFGGKKRKRLSEIMEGVDKSYPIIMMDHQPFGLNEAVENGVDLQLSGHTHHGQLWPFNYITEMVYEVSWGYKKKGNTHFYVSSGYGGWGPPIRLGNTPEIVNIKLDFE
jgi:predicted MPP superfamily phosphohydrolase